MQKISRRGLFSLGIAAAAFAGASRPFGIHAEAAGIEFDTEANEVSRLKRTESVPILDRWPEANNTGVPKGTVLAKSSRITVTEPNAILDSLEITGDVRVEAANVTIKNCRIISDTPYHTVYVVDRLCPGFTMQGCTIIGNLNVNGVLGYGTFLRNDISRVSNGLNIWNSLVQDNYIHDLGGSDDSHYDGIECNGSIVMKIIHNTVVNNFGQTSALMFNNEFGALRDILVDNNRLIGGGYTVYVDWRKDPAKNPTDFSRIKFTNNRMGRGVFGYWATYDKRPIMSGNVDDETGLPI
jgi:hypothetical protein